MRRTTAILLAAAVVLAGAAPGARAAARSPFGRLPPGWTVTNVVTAPPQQVAQIARNLGGEVVGVVNAWVKHDGRQVQVNLIQCRAGAETVLEAVRKAHGGNPAYALLKGQTVYEFCGAGYPMVIEAQYALGLKPTTVTYKVRFEAAPLAGGDYMKFNPLFNRMLEWQAAPDDAARLDAVAALREAFTFGDTLTLRATGQGTRRSLYTFDPAPASRAGPEDGLLACTFADLPRLADMPRVTVTATITSEAFGTVRTRRRPGPALLGPTPFWPVEAERVATLAAQVTEGCTGDEAKVQALLAYLVPGRTYRVGGPTGSRHGVLTFLDRRTGHCWDFADLFITLARASGVPARQVAGWLQGQSGHIWAEVLVGGAWRQVDPTGGTGCTSDYVPWFTSETGEMAAVYLAMPEIEVIQTR